MAVSVTLLLSTDGLGVLRSDVLVEPRMVNTASLASAAVLPLTSRAVTRTRPVCVAVAGTIQPTTPALGIPVAMGDQLPPLSVDSSTSTAAGPKPSGSVAVQVMP